MVPLRISWPRRMLVWVVLLGAFSVSANVVAFRGAYSVGQTDTVVTDFDEGEIPTVVKIPPELIYLGPPEVPAIPRYGISNPFVTPRVIDDSALDLDPNRWWSGIEVVVDRLPVKDFGGY